MTVSDQAQRDTALDPSRSFIVQAPAGSGKTGLLVQRYLRLLGAVERPESIVAMTFTIKAAAEMRERIHDALLAAREDQPVEADFDRKTRALAKAALANDQRHGWNLIEDTGRLQIQTIDSLCAMLVRRMPVVSEFGVVGKVVEDANDLYRVAAQRTLRELAEGDPDEKLLLLTLAAYFDNDLGRLERQMVSMLEQRDQWTFIGEEDHPSEIAHFCRLLSRARETLSHVFRDWGAVDFTEVTRAAIKALGTPDRPSDLLYWLDYQIEHLLVDEFQDTSVAQYDLITALTAQWSDGDGHTLFVVGDPMQSIYRFRGAEVSLFLRCWKQQQLGSVRLTPLSLTTNFRCTPAILRWVEEKFSPVMLADSGGDVVFRHSQAAREAGGCEPELIALLEDSGNEEASAVLQIVQREINNGTVAILLRSRSHVADILPLLRRAGIAYEAVEIAALAEEQHVLDLVSLTRAISHVGDRISWLACLRAPWCGLELADLAALAENEPERTILDLLSDPEKIAQLSAAGRSRAVRVQEILSAAVASVGRIRMRELIEHTWLALGGPALLSQSNHLEDFATCLDLIEAVEEGGVIRDFARLDQMLDGLFAKPGSGDARVQVMTIFKAKGLEFGTVILPKLHKPTQGNGRELLAWSEEVAEDGNVTLHIAAKPQKGGEDETYSSIVQEDDARSMHEIKRVFYVACTRAENKLYLLGSGKLKKDGDLATPRSGTFLRLIWDSVQPAFEAMRRSRALVQNVAAEAQPAKTILRRVPATWKAPRLDPSVQWAPVIERVTASDRRVTYEWVSHTSRHVGTVVHALLHRISAGNSGWTADRLAALLPAIESELRRLGVRRSEAGVGSAQVVRALTNTLKSERGRWILAPHAEARSEWAIGGKIGNVLISGTVDRFFRDERGRLWIIDFKTSEHEGAETAVFLNEEQRRYRPQLESYATLVSRLAGGPVSLGLYFPLLDAWREWEFERQGALFAS
ncbi:MAG: UvrD-helicase domain-containing protein [Acidobacteriaceae bacterium]|nr:UvrD-helicase domain-containing protein [Acidobacteriaceae bacterium]